MDKRFMVLLHTSFLMEENPPDETVGLSPYGPFQLVHPSLNHQRNAFMGCDCHIDMWQRRMEFGLFIPAVEYGHHTQAFFAQRFRQFPDWGMSNRDVIESTYDRLEQELALRPFIYGETFTI